MSNKLFRWLTLVIVPIIAALVAVIGPSLLSAYSTRQRSLQYRVIEQSAIISPKDLHGDDVAITNGNQHRIKNLSLVSVYLYNNSDTDTEDVYLAVHFTYPDGSSPRPICNEKIEEDHLFVESDDPKVQGQLGSPDKPDRFGYHIKVANQSGDANTPIFHADYIFDGATTPQVKVEIVKRGWTATKLPPLTRTAEECTSPYWSIFALLAGCGLTAGVASMKTGKSWIPFL